MSQEKASELFQWKNKLDDLEYLPGEPPIDKGAAWQKLHNRLEKKPRNNKIAWYWLAAASLIAIVFILWLLPGNKKQDSLVTHKRVKPASPLQTSAAKATVQPDTTQQGHVAHGKKQSSATGNKRKSQPEKSEITRGNSVAVSDSSRITESEVVVSVPNPVDTFSQVVTAPLKKKLKVVHINELETNQGQRIEYAGSPSPGFLTTPANRDRLSTVFLTRNASDDIVKIKISPSN